jgi:hypothetical protein
MVKKILKWLKKKISRPTDDVPEYPPSTPATAEPDDLANDDYVIEVSCGEDMPGPRESQEEGVLMPDIYADKHGATAPDLKVLDQPAPDVDEPEGFNPYDTAVLRKKTDFKPR